VLRGDLRMGQHFWVMECGGGEISGWCVEFLIIKSVADSLGKINYLF
jgi:hypothetical protein